VRSIVEAHQGSIEADSPPGAGAVFTVWLPLKAAA
jgi:signal transduction histidine kinase